MQVHYIQADEENLPLQEKCVDGAHLAALNLQMCVCILCTFITARLVSAEGTLMVLEHVQL